MNFHISNSHSYSRSAEPAKAPPAPENIRLSLKLDLLAKLSKAMEERLEIKIQRRREIRQAEKEAMIQELSQKRLDLRLRNDDPRDKISEHERNYPRH